MYFCQIVAGGAPSHGVLEDEKTYAFLNLNPVTPGHMLVIPKAHSADLFDISEEDVAAVMRMSRKSAYLLDARLRPDGMTLFQANRSAGWQTVFHLHVHVVPRYDNDPLVEPWTTTSGTAEELDDMKRRLTEPAD